MTYVLTFPERKLQWPYSTFGVTSFDVTISRTRLGDREVFQYCETNVKTSQNKTHQKRLVAITWSFRNISSSHWRNWRNWNQQIFQNQNALMKPATMIWSKCPVDLWLSISMPGIGQTLTHLLHSTSPSGMEDSNFRIAERFTWDQF